MLGANPVVGLCEERSLTNLDKKLSDLSSHSLDIQDCRICWPGRGVDRVVVGLEQCRGLLSIGPGCGVEHQQIAQAVPCVTVLRATFVEVSSQAGSTAG
jgi:hypothetical protein